MNTDGIAFEVDQQLLVEMTSNPEKVFQGQMAGRSYCLRTGIPNYPQRVQAVYRELIDSPIKVYGERMLHPIPFEHFGVICEFDEPTELHLYDEETLSAGLRALTTRFGPVVIRNAYLPMQIRGEGQRGRFQDLNFHIDRSRKQHSQYSLYTRDPDDPVQSKPRTASTLFIPTLVAMLQDAVETATHLKPIQDPVNNHTLFAKSNVTELIGETIFEQDWSAPEGVGEIAIQHNPDIRHASWYRGSTIKGWPIGVRFLI